MTRTVEVTGLVSDEGTVVVLEGIDVESGQTVRFGCDHRLAGDLLEAFVRDEGPEADVEDWQVLGVLTALEDSW